MNIKNILNIEKINPCVCEGMFHAIPKIYEQLYVIQLLINRRLFIIFSFMEWRDKES